MNLPEGAAQTPSSDGTPDAALSRGSAPGAKPFSLGLAALAAATLFVAGRVLFVPLLFAAVPLVRFGVGRGARMLVVAILLSIGGVVGGLVALGAGPPEIAISVALFLAIVAIPAVFAERGLRESWGIGSTLARVLVAELGIGLAAVALGTGTGPSPTEVFREQAVRNRVVMSEMLTQSGWTAEEIRRVESQSAAFTDFVVYHWPVLPMAILALAGVIALSGVAAVATGEAGEKFRFEELRFPFVTVFVFIAAGLAIAFGDPSVRRVGATTISVVSVLCFLQGFSVIYSFLVRLPVGRWFRWLVYALLIPFPFPMWPAVAGIGLFDEFFDFRRFRP